MDSVNQTNLSKNNPAQVGAAEKGERRSTPERSVPVRDKEEKRKKFKEILDREGVSGDQKEDEIDPLDGPLCRVASHVPPTSLFALVADIQAPVQASTGTKGARTARAPQEVVVVEGMQNITESMVTIEYGHEAYGDGDLVASGGEYEGEEEEALSVTSPYAVGVLQTVDTQGRPAALSQEPTIATRMPKVLADIVKELTHSLAILKTSDRTETQVTLQHPPIFQGVSLNITEFQTSKGQFQLTFFNLTNPEARALIELPHHQALLRAALVERGYQLQMITIEPKLHFKTAVVKTEKSAYRGREQEEQDERGMYE